MHRLNSIRIITAPTAELRKFCHPSAAYFPSHYFHTAGSQPGMHKYYTVPLLASMQFAEHICRRKNPSFGIRFTCGKLSSPPPSARSLYIFYTNCPHLYNLSLPWCIIIFPRLGELQVNLFIVLTNIKMTKFAVVLFPDEEDCIDVISSSWVLPSMTPDQKGGEKICRYPPHSIRGAKLAKLVISHVQPSSTWLVCSCRVLCEFGKFRKLHIHLY